VLKSLLDCQSYVDKSSRIEPQKRQELKTRFSDAMQALQAVNKRMKSIPEGASAMSTTDKLKDLLQMFGLVK
jgi:predicted  nucleic acid-binding Zn-ribbon protein